MVLLLVLIKKHARLDRDPLYILPKKPLTFQKFPKNIVRIELRERGFLLELSPRLTVKIHLFVAQMLQRSE